MRPVQKILLLIGIPVLVLILIITAIVMATRGKAGHGSPGANGELVAAVATLHRSPVAMTEEAPGTIVAIQHADIAPKIMSRIAAVYVHEGDQVKAGQVLARLEGNDLAANVLQAHAGVLNAEASFQQAQTGYGMQRTQSVVAIQQAQAALEQARAQLAKAKQGPRPEQIAQVDEAGRQAKAAYEQAAANLDLVKAGARSQQKLQADQGVLAAQQQVAQAEAGVATSRASLASAQADYDRMKNLYAQDIVSKQSFEHSATQLEASKQAVNQAEASVNLAQAGVQIAKAQASQVYEGARSQEVTAAEKQVEQVRAVYEQAKQEALMAHQGGRWEDIKSAEQAVRQAEGGVRAAKAAQARDQVSAKDITRASAGIAQAKAGLTGAQTMSSYTAIYAPFSGVITGRRADPGSMAMPQMPILSMDDNSRYQLVSQVSERLIGTLRRGVSVMVRLDSLQTTLPATIVEVVPSADPFSRTLTVKANLPHTAGLQSGMFGRLTLSTGVEDVLLAPLSAVVNRNGLTGVYVLDDHSLARFTLVTLGKRRADGVEILSGLQDGQQLVISQVERITAGQHIRAEGGAL